MDCRASGGGGSRGGDAAALPRAAPRASWRRRARRAALLPDAEAAQEQQAVPQSDLDLMEQIQDGDLDEDFPDLDLQYRSPEESDDPALASEDDSDTHELDPFSNWEKEALEQAEEEARHVKLLLGSRL